MHRFIPDPADPASAVASATSSASSTASASASASAPAGEGASWRSDPVQSEAIRRWTREYLRLPESAVVSVLESPCMDPGCPVLETVVAVFAEGEPTRSWRFQRPRAAVTKIMIHQALRG